MLMRHTAPQAVTPTSLTAVAHWRSPSPLPASLGAAAACMSARSMQLCLKEVMLGRSTSNHDTSCPSARRQGRVSSPAPAQRTAGAVRWQKHTRGCELRRPTRAMPSHGS